MIQVHIHDQFFHFSIIERYGILRIKYELKELQMNVYGMFWRDTPSNNERRWWRFELYVSLLVNTVNIYSRWLNIWRLNYGYS